MRQWHIPELWSGGSITQISAGGSHTCVIISTGSVYCTGKNQLGQLGLGNESSQDIYQLTKTSLPNGSHAISISAGDEHTCAVLQNGSVYCWGNLPNSDQMTRAAFLAWWSFPRDTRILQFRFLLEQATHASYWRTVQRCVGAQTPIIN